MIASLKNQGNCIKVKVKIIELNLHDMVLDLIFDWKIYRSKRICSFTWIKERSRMGPI
jgi:hypothetical protein